MQAITLDGEPPIDVAVRQSTRARRLSLRVSALDGRVTLTLPKGIADRTAVDFVRSKEGWLRKHLAAQEVPIPVGMGVELPVQGRVLTLVPGRVRRPTPSGEALVVPGAPDRVGARVQAFLKVLARERLTAASDHYAGLLGRSYGRITLRDTRSRWGSCSSAGDLMFSWRLVLAPPEVLEYVAAHEVAHLEEMHHGPSFWALVERLMPGHAPHRAWLRRNGAGLHRYRFTD